MQKFKSIYLITITKWLRVTAIKQEMVNKHHNKMSKMMPQLKRRTDTEQLIIQSTVQHQCALHTSQHCDVTLLQKHQHCMHALRHANNDLYRSQQKLSGYEVTAMHCIKRQSATHINTSISLAIARFVAFGAHQVSCPSAARMLLLTCIY